MYGGLREGLRCVPPVQAIAAAEDHTVKARADAEQSAQEQIADYAAFAKEATSYAELAERRAMESERRAVRRGSVAWSL